MPIYEAAPTEVRERVERMMTMYHGELEAEKVSIDLLFASPKPDSDGEIDPESYPVKLNGYPCAAVVKVNAYKLRVLNHADAEITIDKQQWEELSEPERDALIDHELEHLEIKRDKDGGVLRDDLDRPKIRLRKHDHQYGWFNAVARRHGEASFEVKQYKVLLESKRQMWLSFDDDQDGLKSEVSDALKKAALSA